MARVVRKKKTRLNRRLYGLLFLVILLAAAGVKLYTLPSSLLDGNRIFRLAADKIFNQSADVQSAEPVLRGRIYDRDYRELAVSYLLYSLYVRPGEITDPEGTVRILARMTGKEPEEIEARLNMPGNLIKVADNLEEAEIAGILDRKIKGVHVQSREGRFYPEHETAAGLVGYAGDGIGLAGVEGAYDLVLQKGGFRRESLPEIHFHDERVLGRSSMDIVLTADLGLEKELEKQLRTYIEQSGAARGVAVLMDARSGAIICWAEQPSFNPNYYWQVPENRGDSLFQAALDSDLYRDVKVRAAAVRRDGELAGPLLPETVAAPDFGLEDEEIARYGDFSALTDNPWQGLFNPGSEAADKESAAGGGRSADLDVLRLAGAVAALVNGGWQVRPHVLASVYDHDLRSHFFRASAFDVEGRRRIVSPAMGIQLRRDLFRPNGAETGDVRIHAVSSTRMADREGYGELILRDLLIGVVPARSPKLVLVMLAQRDDLFPAAGAGHAKPADLAQVGKDILPVLFTESEQHVSEAFPTEPDRSNYSRFLISRRVDYRDLETRTAAADDAVMPELTGLSLRKGLQRLKGYQLSLAIEGSGRIVRQNPRPGSALENVKECVLILEPEI